MPPRSRLALIAALCSLPLALFAGCGEGGGDGTKEPTSNTGTTGTSTGGGNGGEGAGTSTVADGGGGGLIGNGGAGAGTANGGSGGEGGSGPITFTVTKCGNQLYQCGDTIDNDGDGLIDWQDPDCLGPCDNTENSYYNGIPGGGVVQGSCDVDCYWDSNSGSGDDDCIWSHKCDSHEPQGSLKCPHDPNTQVGAKKQSCTALDTTQSTTCIDSCGPLTPNGCDCFGCCELPAGSGKYVFLGTEDANKNGTCTQDGVNDPAKCAACTPVTACLNACEKCEPCIGKPVVTDPSCNPETDQCPGGEQPCGQAGQGVCAAGYYCVTGCCQLAQIPK